MTRTLSRIAVASLLVVAGCGTTAPTDVDLTGTWRATTGVLDIAEMTLVIVEGGSDLTLTGQWVPVAGGAPLGVTGQGLRFGVDINLALVFLTASGGNDYTTAGRVESENTFHLVFAALNGPTRILFQRQ